MVRPFKKKKKFPTDKKLNRRLPVGTFLVVAGGTGVTRRAIASGSKCTLSPFDHTDRSSAPTIRARNHIDIP